MVFRCISTLSPLLLYPSIPQKTSCRMGEIEAATPSSESRSRARRRPASRSSSRRAPARYLAPALSPFRSLYRHILNIIYIYYINYIILYIITSNIIISRGLIPVAHERLPLAELHLLEVGEQPVEVLARQRGYHLRAAQRPLDELAVLLARRRPSRRRLI